MSKHEIKSCHLGFLNLLTVLFIILKLSGVIDWNWFWVVSPTIFTFGFSALIILCSILFALVVTSLVSLGVTKNLVSLTKVKSNKDKS